MSPPTTAVPDASSLRLEVLGKIASGGMARVDLARIADSGRLVALKRLHAHLERDPEFVSMFMDEAWMTAAVDHPNIVRLLGFGRDDEGMFLMMELVDGPSLQGLAAEAHRQGAAMPADLLAYVALLVARGLSAMHELCDQDGNPLGLVHRDLTPSNVLIGLDGSVRITDFGVAKAAGRTSQTSTDVIKGKTRFLSPEYARSRHVDARSDLYSLGLSLFVVATGRQPYEESDSIRVLQAILAEQAPKITDFEPGFDPALSELVDELQRKDPAERPADARQLQQRLEAWLQNNRTSEQVLQRDLARYTAKYGQAKQDRIALLSRASREEEDPGANRDDEPTKLAIARLGAPEEQQTRLAQVRVPVAPATPAETTSPAEPDRNGREQASPRAVTRVVSRPRPTAENATPSRRPTAPLDAAPPSQPLEATDLHRAPLATLSDSKPRPPSPIWTAALVSTAVAGVAVATIIITTPRQGNDYAAPSATVRPVTDRGPAEVVTGGLPVPTASSSSSATIAPPTTEIDPGPDGGTPKGTADSPPRSAPPTPRPSPPRDQPKPRQPCDPSHFDYPECLSR